MPTETPSHESCDFPVATGLCQADVPAKANNSSPFLPLAPSKLEETGLQEVDVESLILKALNSLNAASSRALAQQLKLPGELVRQTLDRLRTELLVVHRGTSDLVDFVFQLTETGIQRAQQYSTKNTYCGAAPVTLAEYSRAVQLQSMSSETIQLENFERAMDGFFLTPDVKNRLAQAVNAGRGLFLYGAPGNGKTSVAERLMACFPDCIWIPRAISISGEILRLFDSSVHQAVDPQQYGIDTEDLELDARWVLIRRPTVIVGGELTMEHLEIQQHHGSNVLEAPVQMKSNGGTLVIDDFGRQRVSATDILNRWIVPLERREDFLTLPNGRQIQVPFEQTLVLATNLEPTSLVDEAFLRRIPFKIELPDPSEQSFRTVFMEAAEKMELKVEEGSFEYLVESCYKTAGVPARYCHARDLLFQIANLCELHRAPRIVTRKTLDIVMRNYFAGELRFARHA